MRSDHVAQRLARNARKREEQRLCAGDFLLFGDTVGQHAKRCVYALPGNGPTGNGHPNLPACSRQYDPGPPPEDEKLYEGTALMALWEDTNESWQLAGWNVRRRAK
jgi:hypothetical protein